MKLCNILPRYKKPLLYLQNLCSTSRWKTIVKLPDAGLHVEPSITGIEWRGFAISRTNQNQSLFVHLETGDWQPVGSLRGPRLASCTGKIRTNIRQSGARHLHTYMVYPSLRSIPSLECLHFRANTRHCETLDGCSITTRRTE